MYSIHDVTSFVYELEQKLNLVTLRYEGSYVYSFLRTRLITQIEQQLCLIAQPHDIPKQRTRWQRYFDFLYYDIKYLLHRGNYDTLVIEHERLVEVEGQFVDIYTEELVKQRNQTEKVMVIRRSAKREDKKYRPYQIKNKHILLRQGFLDRFDPILQKKMRMVPQLEVLDAYSQAVNDYFGISIDANEMLAVEWPKFIRYKHRFMRWLKKYKPQEVIVVVGYYAYEFIEACKECGVKVSEVQHGIIDWNHSGYAYPLQTANKKQVPYFVDHFYAFNTFWTKNCPLPLGHDQVSYIGFLHFRKQKSKYLNNKHKYQVLIISQGTIGSALVDLSTKLANAHEDYVFIFKLHPGEFLNYKERYPQLDKAPTNLLVVKNEVPLYYWMSNAKYMIGAYSTAIYEGLAMNCRVMLINTDGVYDYMKYLIDENVVSVITTVEDFDRCKDEQVNQLGDMIF